MKKIIVLSIYFIAFKAIAQPVVKDTSTTPKILKGQQATVRSNKPLIEQQIDKTIVNVQNDLAAIGSNAFELLQKAPSISITNDDVINMSGKSGVNVLIDGRPTQMSSKDLASFLRGLSGSSIDKIEIIANPSARFDAQGNAGIINIRLKKVKIKGTNGNITLGYTQSKHYRSNGTFAINHRSNKLNLFANASLNHNLQHTDGFINRNVTANNVVKNFNNITVDIDKNTSYNIRTGVDYFINKKNTFGILLNTNANTTPFNTPGITVISTNSVVDSFLQTQNENNYKNKRYNANANYKYEDTIGNELTIDVDYTWFNNTNEAKLATNFLDKNKTQYNNAANNLNTATTINIYTAKADYAKKLHKIKGAFETGLKNTMVSTNNTLDASLLFANSMSPDTGRSNRFNYTENVAAAYVNFRQKINKIEYQIGIRAERSNIQGVSTDLKNNILQTPDTSYFNLFPSAFLSYSLNEKNKVAFSYSKRINRPNYQEMNPFENIYDIYTSEKGNPYLRPQYTNNVELKYIYKNALTVSTGYNHTKDYSQSITTQTGESTRSTPSNIGSLDNFYVNINTPIPVNNWWNGYVNVSFFYNHYKGILPNGTLNEKAFGLNYYIQQSFNLGKGWSTQWSSWFNAGTKEAIFQTASFGSLDASIRKKIWKEKASIRVTISDMLNTQRYKQTVQFANMDFSYLRKWESRGIRLQFTWAFGKAKHQARERETNQDDNRIKVK